MNWLIPTAMEIPAELPRCQYCGNHLHAHAKSSPNRKYCSTECRRAADRTRPRASEARRKSRAAKPTRDVTCKGCGIVFQTSHYRKLFHSGWCKNTYWRRQMREG